MDLQEQEAAHADEPYGTHTSHENAYAEFTKKSLAALAAVDTPASAHAFARHTARQIQNMAAQVPQFYAEEFFNIFKDAVVTQTQADAADCERMIKDAKAEADAASAELQAHLLAARAAGDQQAEHKVWRERKAKQTACQTKIDEASKRADILGTHIEACNQLATVLGLSFD